MPKFVKIFFIFYVVSFFHNLESQEMTRFRWGNNQEILDFVKPYLPKDPVIIEAGAYDGRESADIAKFWPEGKVYCFEPVPELFEKVSFHLKSQPNAKCFNKALSDKNGTAALHLSVEQSEILCMCHVRALY